MKEGHKSIDDILREVAEDEGMNFRQIRDVWKHQKLYIKKKMEQDDVYAIFLPSLGTLCLNTKQYLRERRGKNREYYKTLKEKVERLINHQRYGIYGNAHKKITGVNKIARYVIKHFHTGIEVTRKIIPHKICWPIIEKYSNGGYEKRDEVLTIELQRKLKNRR